LKSWIFSGQLHDPFNEFFIQLNGDLAKRSLARHTPYGDYGFEGGDSEFAADDPHMIWDKRYIFVKDMLPSFINEEFGRKVCSELLVIAQPMSSPLLECRSSLLAKVSILSGLVAMTANGRRSKHSLHRMTQVSALALDFGLGRS
jgi:hypothetical protein